MAMLGELTALRSIRDAKHRLRNDLAISNASEALTFVLDRQVALLLGHDSVASLPDAIAGHAIRGSWMADPAVVKIYEILNALPDDQVIIARWLGGRRTVFSPALGPAFVRLITDPDRQRILAEELPYSARQLLNEVEQRTRVRTSALSASVDTIRKARSVLEKNMLVSSNPTETKCGKHETELRSWSVDPIVIRYASQASELQLDTSVERLVSACLASSVFTEERIAGRWFSEARNCLISMKKNGSICTVAGRPGLIYLNGTL